MQDIPRVMPPLPADMQGYEPISGEAFPPQIEQKLSHFKLIEGADATFVCKVIGNPCPAVSSFYLF